MLTRARGVGDMRARCIGDHGDRAAVVGPGPGPFRNVAHSCHEPRYVCRCSQA
jgi:hypothetical protein